MDFIAFINSQEPVASWTVTKKQALLDDLATACGWTEECGLTKKQICNNMIRDSIVISINNVRKSNAEGIALESVTYDVMSME